MKFLKKISLTSYILPLTFFQLSWRGLIVTLDKAPPHSEVRSKQDGGFY